MAMAALTSCAVIWAVPASRAADLDGTYFPDTMETPAGPLVLSGCGLREVLWQDAYAIGLYLAGSPVEPDRIRRPDQAKLIRIEVLFDGDIPEDLPSEWRTHLDEILRRDVLKTFRDLYRELKTGDRVTLAYTPAHGTSVRLNDESEIKSAGHEVMDAFLELWLGPKPVSKNLRRLLLSGKC